MADFSKTTLFVVPVGNTLPSADSTQDLAAGQVGIFLNTYAVANVGNIAAAPYFYVAQGRVNTYLQGSKRSDKIKGCATTGCKTNIVEWYKVSGCPTPINQITDVTDWNVKCGDIVTLTIRGFSSYLETLYFNGFTRSVTVQAPCCDCGGDPCVNVNDSDLIDALILKLNAAAPDFLGGNTTGTNPDNIRLSQFYTFTNVGGTILRIEGKPLTKYGQPCDVAAFPWEYDKLRFRTFVYSGPATTADFIVADNCNIVAEATIVQQSTYATGTSDEIAQLEKNFYSYQAGYLKHLYRIAGYNPNFESWVAANSAYDMYVIKFKDMDVSAETWGDYIIEDSTVMIAAIAGSAAGTAIELVLEAALGAVASDTICITTTSTTTTALVV